MKRIALTLVVLILLAYCPTVGLSQMVGDNAPDFSLVDVSGNDVRLSDIKGKKMES
jgi:peroxiredoxin